MFIKFYNGSKHTPINGNEYYILAKCDDNNIKIKKSFYIYNSNPLTFIAEIDDIELTDKYIEITEDEFKSLYLLELINTKHRIKKYFNDELYKKVHHINTINIKYNINDIISKKLNYNTSIQKEIYNYEMNLKLILNFDLFMLLSMIYTIN